MNISYDEKDQKDFEEKNEPKVKMPKKGIAASNDSLNYSMSSEG